MNVSRQVRKISAGTTVDEHGLGQADNSRLEKAADRLPGARFRVAQRFSAATEDCNNLPALAAAVILEATLKLDRHGFAVGFGYLEELPLLKAKHAGDQVGGERLDFGVEVAHHGVVVATRILNGVLSLA